MQILATEIKDHICLESDTFSVADSLISLQNIYSSRLESDILGRHKGSIPWNKGKKGLYKNTADAWNKGVPHTKEHNAKISSALKGNTFRRNKPCSELTKTKISNSNKGIKNGMYGISGEKCPAWLGGISFEPYCSKFNEHLKEQIRERDHRTCQLCGEKENGIKLACHHIHYDKPNCAPDLITLCKSCNSKVNFNRDYYEALFMNMLIIGE